MVLTYPLSGLLFIHFFLFANLNYYLLIVFFCSVCFFFFFTEKRKENTSKKANNSDVKNYSCFFCNVNYDTVEEFRNHCSTQSHQTIIMSDEGRDWKKRPPPRGLTADTYK